jgi:hypothetical protein
LNIVWNWTLGMKELKKFFLILNKYFIYCPTKLQQISTNHI